MNEGKNSFNEESEVQITRQMPFDKKFLNQFELELDNYIPETNNAENIRWLEERGFIFKSGV